MLTQNSNKMLVAALLLTLVSPVVATPTKLQRAKDFFMPVFYKTAEDKEAALAKFNDAGKAERIKNLEAKIKAESEVKFADADEAKAQAEYVTELQAQLVDLNADVKASAGLRGKLNRFNVNTYNLLPGAAVITAAALVTAAVTAAVKYELPQRALAKAKAFFKKN